MQKPLRWDGRHLVTLAACGLFAVVAGPLKGAPMATRFLTQAALEPEATFSRASMATYFDAEQGRLLEVPANVPRFERWPGKPWGAPVGLRLENPAVNFLPNSSFEAGMQGWRATGEVKAAVEAGVALHGQASLHVTGTGRTVYEPVELTVQAREPFHNLFTISVYLRRQDGQPVTLDQAWPFVAPQGQEQNAIHWGSRRVERLGETPWYRLSANFGVNGAPLAFRVWECGLEVRTGEPLYIDAAQVEQGEPRWMGGATSYIPTGEAPARRAGELLSYPAEGRLGPRGSISFWVRPILPPHGYWFCPQPWSASGLTVAATWLQINGAHLDYAAPPEGWDFVTVTWDGSGAPVYLNGQGLRPENDLLPYPAFPQWPSPAFALSRPEGGAGADAVVADVALWSDALTPAQARQLFLTGDIAGAVEPPPEKMTPVRYRVPVAGLVSLGLYNQAGQLVRTLFSGKQQGPGEYEFPWDGRDDEGNPLPIAEYEVRGVVGNLSQEVEQIIGNTSPGPVDDYHVYRCMYGGYIGLAMLPDGSCLQQTQACEASFTTQKVAPDGKVIWSKPCEFGAASYETHAICTDGKYLYTLQPSQFDLDPATRKLRLYEFLGKCAVETGDRILFPGDRPIIPVSEAREVANLQAGMYQGATHSDPFPGLNARHLAAGGGKVYISLHYDNRIDMYDRETGEKIGSIGEIPRPQGVAVDAAGNLYVCSDRRVLRVAPNGSKVVVVAQDLEAPWNLTLDRAGNLYVCDLGTQQVKKFSPQGRLLLTIGQAGGSWNGKVSDDGFNMPIAVAVGPQGEILIADRGHWRVQVFSADGKRLLQSRMACGTNIPFLNLSNPEWLYAEGWGPFGLQVARYRLDWEKKTWTLDSMWELNERAEFADLSRTLAHGGSWHALDLGGKTYIYKLDATLIMRVEPDRIVPCLALGGKGLASVPVVRDAQGRPVEMDFERRWVWVNKNGDYHCQADEFTFFGEGTLEGWRASYVDLDGTISLSDRAGRPGIGVYRFPLLGLDEQGNPLYSWEKAEKIWTLPAEEALWPYVALWGFHRDGQGRSFALVRDDNYGNPQGGYLAGYDQNNVRMWKTGKIVAGIPRPGEFIQPEAVGVVDDGLVYAWDVDGEVQAFTTDGLFVGRLLASQWTGQPSGPLSGGGESFDSKTYRIGGQTYLLCGGNAGFRLGLYRVTGIEGMQRFTGTVRLAEMAAPRVASSPVGPGRKRQVIVPAPAAVTIDGDLAEWDRSAGEEIEVPGSEGRYKATGYAMYDREYLYLAYAITDSSPALNTGVLSTLFNGDCVEVFISTDPQLPLAHGWTDRDYQFVLPAFFATGPTRGRAQVTRIQPRLEAVPGADMALKVWEDKHGYNVEAKIPWTYFGDFQPAPGKRVAWDWNIDWSDASGSVRALQYYWNAINNWQTPTGWGEAEFK